jgi:hypothetical protein
MRSLVAVLLAIVCGAGPVRGQTPAIRPGTYDLTITIGGGQLDGVLALDIKGDSTHVDLTVGGHSPAFRRIERKGSALTLVGGAEGMLVEYQLQFGADTVTGVLNYNGSDGTVTGRRRGPKNG